MDRNGVLESVSRPSVLVGTSAIALVLGASRWGTNIGVSPLFLTDVLIFLGLVSWMLISQLKGKRSFSDYATRRRPSTLFVIFYLYILIRFISSIGNGQLLYWVRDGAPFLYGFLAFVSAAALARSTPAVRQRSMLVFWWALSAHAAWMLVVVTTKLPAINTPLGSLFQMRPDIDAAILGVGAGLYLIQVFRRKKKVWPLLGFVASVAGVLSMGSRAALLSLAVSLALAFAIHYSSTTNQRNARTFLQVALPVILVGTLLALPFTVQGERIMATLSSSQGETTNQLNAQGTERARQLVWDGIITWVGEKDSRFLVGSGFGNDFLTESGTLLYLEGTTYENVRSPHNWFIGIFARMGLVGLVLSVLVCVQLVVTIFRNRRRMASDPLLALSGLIIVGIIPVASLGVVMEAPFGAVPFWWAAGIILSLRGQRVSTRSNLIDQRRLRAEISP